MSSAFPSLPDALDRASGLGVDASRSFRDWVGGLTGKTGVELDRLIEEGLRFGAMAGGDPPGYIAGCRYQPTPVLRPSERRVLSYAAIGMDSLETAVATQRSPYTIRKQIAQARQRLGVGTVTEAVVRALITGQLDWRVLAEHFTGPGAEPIGAADGTRA